MRTSFSELRRPNEPCFRSHVINDDDENDDDDGIRRRSFFSMASTDIANPLMQLGMNMAAQPAKRTAPAPRRHTKKWQNTSKQQQQTTTAPTQHIFL